MYWCLRVKCPKVFVLFWPNLETIDTFFESKKKYKISEKQLQMGVAVVPADRRTDMAKVLGVFPTMLMVLNSTTRQFPSDVKYKLCIISQINRLKPTAYAKHQQFNIQQL